MDFIIEGQIFIDWLLLHWVSAIFLSLTLLTILLLAGARWWWKRRCIRLIEDTFTPEAELDLLPPLGAKDIEALELIRRRRKAVWEIPEAELQLTIEDISQRAMGIVRPIAEIYFPSAEVPEYEATLVESLQLIRRVSTRLIRLATITPFKLLGNRKLNEYQRFYQVYKKINENPILQLLKRSPHLYKAARWALNIKNLGNPFYWAGKEISREGYFFMVRWFHMAVISQVGKEAMRLYSGRRFQKEEDRDAALICHRLFALTLRWDGPSPEEWAMLVDFVTNQPVLEPEIKLHILSSWSKRRMPKDLEEQPLQTEAGVKWFRQGLKRLSETDPRRLSVKELSIQDELTVLDAGE
jgi:hypothetical protein